jgi:hypothetical protein
MITITPWHPVASLADPAMRHARVAGVHHIIRREQFGAFSDETRALLSTRARASMQSAQVNRLQIALPAAVASGASVTSIGVCCQAKRIATEANMMRWGVHRWATLCWRRYSG